MQILLLTAMAGVVGMGLGGIVAAILGTVSPKVMAWMLSFAGGVMVSVVSFELVPEGIELAGMGIAIAGIVLGIAVVAILNRLLDRVTIKDGDSLEAHISQAGTYHEGSLVEKSSLLRSGIIMLIAISLHNLPEGIAVGAAGTHDIRMGIVLAVVIMLHCIPEGMAIGAPLIGGGMSRGKAVALTALSGVPTIIGGAIGMFVGGISDATLALALTGAGGAMLYVVFGEILPQSSIITKSRFTTFAALFGIVVGLLITALH